MNRNFKWTRIAALLTILVVLAISGTSVFAQDGYPLAGQEYDGYVGNNVNALYNARWEADGTLWQYQIPEEEDRVAHVVSVTIEEGDYKLFAVECNMGVDLDKNEAAYTEGLNLDLLPSSVYELVLGYGNRLPFTIDTPDNGQAWARLVCRGNESTGFKIEAVRWSGSRSVNPQATSPAGATPVPATVPTYQGRQPDQTDYLPMTGSSDCGSGGWSMGNGTAQENVDVFGDGTLYHVECHNGYLYKWVVTGQGTLPTQPAPMATQPYVAPQGGRIQPANCSPTDAARPGYVLIPSTDARWQTATDCSAMYEFNLSYCPSTDPVGRTLNRDLSAYQGTNLSCQYLPLERSEEQQDVVPQWLKDAGDSVWGFVRANWVWIIVLIAIALWLRSRRNSGHGHTATPAAAAAHPTPAHGTTRNWRNGFGLLPSAHPHVNRMTLTPTTVVIGTPGTFAVTGNNGAVLFRYNANGTGLIVDPVSGAYSFGTTPVVGVARVTVVDNTGSEEFDVNVTTTAPAAPVPATPVPAPAPAVTAAWGDVTPNTGAAATALPIHIRLTNADTLTATKVEVGTATVTITGMTRDAVGHMLTVNAEIPANTLTPGGMYPIKVTLADGTVITSPANAFSAS